MPGKIIMDVTPPQEPKNGKVDIGMSSDANSTVISVGSALENATVIDNYVYHEMPYGFKNGFPKDATISIQSNGKEIGQISTNELAEAKKSNGGVLIDYAEALLNKETTKNFAEFAVEQQPKVEEMNKRYEQYKMEEMKKQYEQYMQERPQSERSEQNPDQQNQQQQNRPKQGNYR